MVVPPGDTDNKFISLPGSCIYKTNKKQLILTLAYWKNKNNHDTFYLDRMSPNPHQYQNYFSSYPI